MIRYVRVVFGVAAAGCLAGLSAESVGGTGAAWSARPMSRGETAAVRGGAGTCYVPLNTDCSFANLVGPCRGQVAGPNAACNPDVGFYQTVDVLHRVTLATAGKMQKLVGEPLWCYNKYECIPKEINGHWECSQGAYVGHSTQFDETFPTGDDCMSE